MSRSRKVYALACLAAAAGVAGMLFFGLGYGGPELTWLLWVGFGLLMAALIGFEVSKGLRQKDQPAPPASAFDEDASFGPSHVLPPANGVPPAVGASAGAVRVVSLTPYVMVLRARPVEALALVLGGAALIVVVCLLFALAVWRIVSPQPHDNERWRGFEFALMFSPLALLGLFLCTTGAHRLGLVYTFDARSRTVRCQRRFGREQLWKANDVDHIQMTITPPEADGIANRERLVIALVGRDGKRITADPIFGHVRTGGNNALNAARAGIVVARMLRVPIQVEGTVVHGTKELAALLAAESR